MENRNLFAALRAAFPQDLDGIAIETADGPGAPLAYTWRDLERGTAMMANVLVSLHLAPDSRVAVQTDKSVEALLLYLAVQRAGYVYLPLNSAYQQHEIEYFIRDAEPAVVVCTPKSFTWISRLAFAGGTKNVFTLGDDRTGSLLERAALMGEQHTPALKR
jgi:malonyl-CoA/methylmalonyl-CoA synthetase